MRQGEASFGQLTRLVARQHPLVEKTRESHRQAMNESAPPIRVGIPPKYWKKTDESGRPCLAVQGFAIRGLCRQKLTLRAHILHAILEVCSHPAPLLVNYCNKVQSMGNGYEMVALRTRSTGKLRANGTMTGQLGQVIQSLLEGSSEGMNRNESI